MVRHRQGVPVGGRSQGKAVGKQPHWTSGSQEIREMSRIKLPAVEKMVVFVRLLNGVEEGPQLCGLSNNPDVLPLLAPLALSSSFHS